jgi:undecaprenyl-diphosphatase
VNLLQAIFLGFVQGVAEFLPISSSGHLAIFQNLFHMNGVGEVDLFFDVLLHFGTLFSVLLVYWKDIRGIVLEFFTMLRLRRRPEREREDPISRRMIWFIITGTLPLVVALLFKDAVENLYSNMFFIAFALAATGLILFLSDRFGSGKKQAKNATILDALLVCVGQMLAIVPGLSRSGTTISAGMTRGFERSFSVKFSFLLSIPAILGASLLELIEVITTGIDVSMLPYYLAGMITAAVCGYLSIRLLERITKSNRFGAFAYYCWGAAAVTLFLSLIA